MRSLFLIMAWAFLVSCNAGKNTNLTQNDFNANPENIDTMINKSEEEWKTELNPFQYFVMFEKGTERPYTGEYWNVFEDGTYRCAACGAELFDSDTKFDAGCGWPSFYDSIDKSKIKTDTDYKLGYARTEIMCARCGAHLGHVFEDGPAPTGLRYCVNSASIKLDTTEEK
ncbi:MAG: peptide-methionine (R)-S-oxide reductase MsrB [Saprospiraceae bacterium]